MSAGRSAFIIAGRPILLLSSGAAVPTTSKLCIHLSLCEDATQRPAGLKLPQSSSQLPCDLPLGRSHSRSSPLLSNTQSLPDFASTCRATTLLGGNGKSKQKEMFWPLSDSPPLLSDNGSTATESLCPSQPARIKHCPAVDSTELDIKLEVRLHGITPPAAKSQGFLSGSKASSRASLKRLPGRQRARPAERRGASMTHALWLASGCLSELLRPQAATAFCAKFARGQVFQESWS
mmetsp:Transcript_74445/g.131647  ORF Transcript_74445/g.131647 Transcript_74445/m.131647 type:complete len:235 (-) Transcript_74445:397-1101(-)